RDGTELPDIGPTGGDDAADDIGGKLELEPQQQPEAEAEPDLLPRCPGCRISEGTNRELDSRLEGAVANHENCHGLDRQGHANRDFLENFFHDASAGSASRWSRPHKGQRRLGKTPGGLRILELENGA